MPGIFISYRREDCAPYAGRLYDWISQRFGKENTFIDLDTIQPGEDYVVIVGERVGACDVLIALIGKNWLSCADDKGNRRLDNPKDLLRLEIVSALNRKVRVIPVLVDGAQMPNERDMPEQLVDLVWRHALEYSTKHFLQEIQQLNEVLQRILAAAEEGRKGVAEIQRLAAEKAEAERLATAEAERLAVERAKAERLAAIKAGPQRVKPPLIQTPPAPRLPPSLAALDSAAIRLLHTLAGHSLSVLSVAVSVDGRRALSASADKTLKVWDPKTGRELRSLAGHSLSVLSVAVSPDGRRAISGSWKELKVWDLKTGLELRILTGHTSFVNGVAIGPDGSRAVSASRDYTLRVWDMDTGRTLRTLAHSDYPVLGVAISPDGRRVVSASSDKTLKVWDLETGREQRTLSGHKSSVLGVAISPDGRHAVSASRDNTVRVWDLETGGERYNLAGHSDCVWGVAVSPGGRCILSASADKTLRVWDLETGGSIATFTCDSAALCCAFASDRTMIAGDDRGRVHFLELAPLH